MLTVEQIEKLRQLIDIAQSDYYYAKAAEEAEDHEYIATFYVEWRADYEQSQKALEEFIASLEGK